MTAALAADPSWRHARESRAGGWMRALLAAVALSFGRSCGTLRGPYNPPLPKYSAVLYDPSPVSAAVLNVKDHGAVGDGRANDTAALRRTIEACERGVRQPGVPCVYWCQLQTTWLRPSLPQLELRIDGSLFGSFNIEDWHWGPRGNDTDLIMPSVLRMLRFLDHGASLRSSPRSDRCLLSRASQTVLVAQFPREAEYWYFAMAVALVQHTATATGAQKARCLAYSIRQTSMCGLELTWPAAWHAHLITTRAC